MKNDLFGVVIDAGHGGSDPGAVSGNTKEKDLTLQISNYMYERFKEMGIPVYITRSTDETLNPTERVNRILNAFGNRDDVVVISNHINSNATGNVQGAEVIYALRNEKTLAQNILNALGKAGQKTRTVYQRRLPSDMSKDYYFIHRNTGITEPLIIEYGFINNAEDLNRIKNNYKRYVDAIVNAVIETKKGVVPPLNNTYIVQKGDSLWTIARKYNTTVDTLKRLNNLTNDDLYIGQILMLPTNNENKPGENIPNETTYIVKVGDSLWSIANKYNTTVDTLKKLNNLTSDILYVGQILNLPNGNTEIENPGEVGMYVVRKGDTLWNIANRFDTNVNELIRLNNLKSDILNIGQVLIIPNYIGTMPGIIYTVKNGDSLWSIARTYNTTVDAIKNLNNLTSNLITVGQTLQIPSS